LTVLKPARGELQASAEGFTEGHTPAQFSRHALRQNRWVLVP
jgi:hypothetical protein